MNRNNLFWAALVLQCFLFFSCKSSSEEDSSQRIGEHISDEQAREIILNSIKTHGGLDRWNSIERFEYDKSMTLYLEDGEIESSVEQNHLYQYGADEVFRVRWMSGEDEHVLYGRRGEYSKTINQQPDQSASPELSKNSLFSSMYVIGIPYKLLDAGPDITYEGKEEIWTGETCDVIKVMYDPEAHPNLTTADTWWYYFDVKDARVRAGKVKHLDHISGIRNISYVTANGFLLNHERESYRLGDNDSVLYLRARYLYDGYGIKTVDLNR